MAKKKNIDDYEDSILWYDYDLTDPKDMKKVINKLKQLCQKSLEYSVWSKRTKIEANEYIDCCPICLEYYNYVKADTHHHPLTISEVIENVLTEEIMKNTINDLSGLEIVQKIMMKHLNKDVDYIVLCTHCHEKYHAGEPEICEKVDRTFSEQVKNDYKKVGVKRTENLNKEDKNDTNKYLKDCFNNINDIKII